MQLPPPGFGWPRAWCLAAALWALACSPPIDDDRCFEDRCAAGEVCVAGRCAPAGGADAAPPDGADVAPPDQGPVDAACEPLAPLSSAEPAELVASELERVVRLGLAQPGAGVGALDGDGVGDVVAVSAGAVTASNVFGALLWTVDAEGATVATPPLDLDRDGRAEVLLYGDAHVRVVDGLTGAERWRLAGSQAKRLEGRDRVDTVRVGPVDGSGGLAVFIGEQGCDDDDQETKGTVVRFPTGLDGPVEQEVVLADQTAECTDQAVLTTLGPAGPGGVLSVVRQQITLFSADDGRPAWCGLVDGIGAEWRILVDEVLPDPAGPEVVVVDDRSWWVFASEDGRWPDCLSRDEPVAPVASGIGRFALDAVAVVDGPDGDPRLALTEVDDEIQVLLIDPLSDGVTRVPGWALGGVVGAYADEEAVVAPTQLVLRQAQNNPNGERLALYDPTDAGAEPEFLVANGLPFLDSAPLGLGGRSAGLARILTIQDPETRVPALPLMFGVGLDGVGGDVVLAVDGQIGPRYPIAGRPVAQGLTCQEAGCTRADGLVLLGSDGQAAAFDFGGPQLFKAGPAPDRVGPVGSPLQLLVTTDTPPAVVAGLLPAQGARSPARVVGVDLAAPRAPERWARIGTGDLLAPALVPRPEAVDLVLVRGRSGTRVDWIALDPRTGDEVWTHGQQGTGRRADVADAAPVTVLPQAGDPLVLRVDGLGVEDVDALADPLRDGCPVQRAGSDQALEACTLARVGVAVTALHAADGRCAWRLLACEPAVDPLNQLSVVLADDGAPELYFAVAGSLLRLDPATGAVQASANLTLETGGLGGRVVRHPLQDLRIRAGGGPLDAWTPELSLSGQTPAPADGGAFDEVQVSDGALWLRRGDRLWWSATAQDGQLAAVQAARLDAQGLALEARPEDGAGDPVLGLGVAAGLPGAPVVARTGERVHQLSRSGDRPWVLRPGVGPTTPWATDLDGDGAQELVLATADGWIRQGRQRTLSPPARVRHRPCEQAALCVDDDASLAELSTAAVDPLCVGFQTVREADRYEARLLDPAGVPLTGWEPAEAGTASLRAPEGLQPGPGAPGGAHVIEVRALAGQGDTLAVSLPAQSPGLALLDEAPPTVSLEVAVDDQPPFAATLDVTGRDEYRLAGRALSVLDARGEVVWSVPLGATGGAVWFDVYVWRWRATAPPGRYTARATVWDQAGQTATVDVPFTVCEGPCP